MSNRPQASEGETRQLALTFSEIRFSRIAALQERIRLGTYRVSSAELAQKMLGSLRSYQGAVDFERSMPRTATLEERRRRAGSACDRLIGEADVQGGFYATRRTDA